jgi:hypothetical protein
VSARAAVAAACFTGAFFVAACSSGDGAGDKPGTGGGAGTPGSGGATGSGGEAGGNAGAPDGSGGAGQGGAGGGAGMPAIPTACSDDSTMYPCILHIDGKAIDANDKAIEDHTLVSACGPTQCNPGYTSATGAFAIPVGLHINPDVYSAQVHVRPDKAAFYYALPKGTKGPVVDMGSLRVLDMPATGPKLNVNRMGVPAQTVTSGEVTLDVPDGVYVRLDVESNLAGDHGKEFRALTIPSNFMAEFADASLGIKVMYALEPFESSYEIPGTPAKPANVRLTFANSAKLAAGAAVDVLALGTYIYPDWLTPATFQKVASAHVSADGSKVELDKDEGLPYLTWVALRPAP